MTAPIQPTASTAANLLPLDTPFGVRAGPGTMLDLATGNVVPLTAQTVTAILATRSDADEPLHADLSITLTPTATAGVYVGVFESAALRARLGALVNSTVWLIVRAGTLARTRRAFRVVASSPAA